MPKAVTFELDDASAARIENCVASGSLPSTQACFEADSVSDSFAR
jgi:hypothetical protein